MEQVCPKENCYGCTACYNVCPTEAISMKKDQEGFLYPNIDQNLCIDCGKCKEVCPVYHDDFLEEYEEQKFFALKNSDSVRKESSSGGVFTALSDYFIENGGIVVGAKYSSGFSVEHKITNNKEVRDQFRGSKYIQSDLDSLFKEIESKLKNDKEVLFVGTPCQVDGLNLFLGKSYSNLTTCDLLCHGVASPRVFKEFIGFVESKTNDKLLNYQFRDKEIGWRGYNVSAELKNKKIKNKLWLKSFNYLFSQNYINRPSCSNCKFFTYNRTSDLTMGDFWGIEKFYPEFEDSLGVSLLILNLRIVVITSC